MKKITKITAIATLAITLFTSTASAVKMYSPDGRTASVMESDVAAWKAKGWSTKNYKTMYAPDGRTMVIATSDVEAWKAVGWYDAPVTSQPSYTIDAPATDPKGSLMNPYFALEGATLAHQKWPNASTRNISLKCKQVMRGNTANQLAASESIHNTVPADGQEWCFIEFDIEYISSSNGMNDPVQANDIIYTDSLFTEKGNSLVVYEIATHGTNLNGYGVIDNQLYPGSSGTVIIGLLINSSTKDILLRVPYKSQNTNSWIKCN